MSLTTQERKELREKIERYLEQAINKADGLYTNYLISLDYHKESGRIASCEQNTGETGYNPAWINILKVQAWDSAGDSEEAADQNINYRREVYEWSKEIDEAIDEIEKCLEENEELRTAPGRKITKIEGTCNKCYCEDLHEHDISMEQKRNPGLSNAWSTFTMCHTCQNMSR